MNGVALNYFNHVVFFKFKNPKEIIIICGRYRLVGSHLTWRMLTTFLARKGPGLDACDMPTPV